MTPRMIETVLGMAVVFATVLWLGLLPGELLGRILWLALVWSLISTLLVATAAAWVALRRSLSRRAVLAVPSAPARRRRH